MRGLQAWQSLPAGTYGCPLARASFQASVRCLVACLKACSGLGVAGPWRIALFKGPIPTFFTEFTKTNSLARGSHEASAQVPSFVPRAHECRLCGPLASQPYACCLHGSHGPHSLRASACILWRGAEPCIMPRAGFCGPMLPCLRCCFSGIWRTTISKAQSQQDRGASTLTRL